MRKPKRSGKLKAENNLLQLMIYCHPHQKAAIIEQQEFEQGARPGLSMSNTILLAVLEKVAKRRREPLNSLGPLPTARKRAKARVAARTTGKPTHLR